MTQPDTIMLICTRESFQSVKCDSVRWLAPNADYYRIQQAMRTDGLDPPDFETWLEWHRQGRRFCATTLMGTIVAQASVVKSSDCDWELAEVRTQAAARRRGHGLAVASFITAYILGERQQAICHALASTIGMQELAMKLGYIRL